MDDEILFINLNEDAAPQAAIDVDTGLLTKRLVLLTSGTLPLNILDSVRLGMKLISMGAHRAGLDLFDSTILGRRNATTQPKDHLVEIIASIPEAEVLIRHEPPVNAPYGPLKRGRKGKSKRW